ncbi:MAG TPA: PEP-CTERM sorting domain-containing protein [Vicinamibacterales bacterium]|nr:PEP-CTERM sorting domain-containing protein [Vicinamibacterales bacterium]
MRKVLRVVVVFVGLLWAQSAQADPYRLLVESDANATAGHEVFVATYATLDNFLNSVPAGGSFSQINISAGFGVGGLAFDGSYRLLVESDTNTTAGNELFLSSYASFADFLSSTPSSGSFSQVNVSAGFSSVGFTFDGSQYHLLVESDANATAGHELFLASYNSLTDFLSSTPAGGGFSQINVSAGFSVGGFTFDDGGYRLLVETDANATGGHELFLASYGSLDAFRNSTIGTGSFSQVNVSAGFSAAAFLAEPTPLPPPPPPPPPTGVPEPSTLLMLGLGFAATGVQRLRQSR